MILSIKNSLISMKKLYSCGIFIDLQEAFHDLLLCKLKYYGMRGIANCWFCSNRRQTIQVSPYITKNEVTSCGAPQDSVLSPLLFLISQMISPIHLINWISFCLPVTRTCSMLIRISPLWELTVDRELAVVCDWLMANKLSLNMEKSNFVIFRSYQKWMNFDIQLFDHDKNSFILLEMKDYVKCLEILIDSNLTWKQHILDISLAKRQRATIQNKY